MSTAEDERYIPGTEIVSRVVRDLDDGGKLLWIPDSKTEAGRRTLQVPELLQSHLLAIAEGKPSEAKLFARALAIFAVLHTAVYVNFAVLARPRMRPLAYRLLVSWPASFFVAATLLSLPWALAVAFGFHPWAPWLPYAYVKIG